MANNRQYGPQNYSGQSYNGPWNPNYNGNGNRNNGNWSNNKNINNGSQNFKKSGATYTRIKKGKNEGQMAINAWRKTRYGLMTANAMPVGGGQAYESQKGDTYVRYAVDISNKAIGTSQTYWCLMNVKTQVLTIKELGLVITPNGRGTTKSGKRVTGYFGKF